jgi:hypothetical protein
MKGHIYLPLMEYLFIILIFVNSLRYTPISLKVLQNLFGKILGINKSSTLKLEKCAE